MSEPSRNADYVGSLLKWVADEMDYLNSIETTDYGRGCLETLRQVRLRLPTVSCFCRNPTRQGIAHRSHECLPIGPVSIGSIGVATLCECDFDASYTGGLCDTCGLPDPTPGRVVPTDQSWACPACGCIESVETWSCWRCGEPQPLAHNGSSGAAE